MAYGASRRHPIDRHPPIGRTRKFPSDGKKRTPKPQTPDRPPSRQTRQIPVGLENATATECRLDRPLAVIFPSDGNLPPSRNIVWIVRQPSFSRPTGNGIPLGEGAAITEFWRSGKDRGGACQDRNIHGNPPWGEGAIFHAISGGGRGSPGPSRGHYGPPGIPKG